MKNYSYPVYKNVENHSVTPGHQITNAGQVNDFLNSIKLFFLRMSHYNV